MRRAAFAIAVMVLTTTAWGQARPSPRYDVDRIPFVEIGGDGTAGNPILGSVFSAIKTTAGFVVAESRSSTLLLLNDKGKLLRTVGRQGQGPGEFNGGIFVNRCAGDSLFAWDSRTMRILVFAPSGEYVRQVQAIAAQFACSRAGVIALLLRPTNVSQGNGPPERLSAAKLIDLNGDSVGAVASVPFGQSRMFGPSASIAVRGEELYVGTGREPAVDVYDRRGRPLRRITFPHSPVRIATATFEKTVDGFLDFMKLDGAPRAQQRARLLALGHPAEYPPYREIAVAPNGTVWLLTTQLSDSVAHVKAVRDDGAIVAEADLPGGTARLLEAGDDYLLLTYTTPDGDMKVGAFRVRRRVG